MNIFHNFWSSTKFYMNFYWIKLDLARFKIICIPEARYIYFIFFNPRTHQDLSNEIYFINFWAQFKFVQDLEELLRFEFILKMNKGNKASGPNQLMAHSHRNAAVHDMPVGPTLWPARTGLEAAHGTAVGSVGRPRCDTDGVGRRPSGAGWLKQMLQRGKLQHNDVLRTEENGW
jgi:hypothetical protein